MGGLKFHQQVFIHGVKPIAAVQRVGHSGVHLADMGDWSQCFSALTSLNLSGHFLMLKSEGIGGRYVPENITGSVCTPNPLFKYTKTHTQHLPSALGWGLLQVDHLISLGGWNDAVSIYLSIHPKSSVSQCSGSMAREVNRSRRLRPISNQSSEKQCMSWMTRKKPSQLHTLRSGDVQFTRRLECRISPLLMHLQH